MNRNSANKKSYKTKSNTKSNTKSKTNRTENDSMSYSNSEPLKKYKAKAKPNTNRTDKDSTSQSIQESTKKYKPRNKSKRKNDDTIRLNKYVAHGGVCSRRDADMYIEAGVVKVNGKVVQELGYRVTLDDKVQFEDQTLRYQ